jgi:hypothetical protein
MTLWRWLISVLAWLAADPSAVEVERARAAGAVAVAYAATATEAPAPPAPAPPKPTECACGGTCVNGYWKPDGRIVQACPCPASCGCKAGKCPDGKCPQR